MNNLRVNSNQEYFKDSLPVTFLSDVKDVNIIIGANNTRKSRFLRQLIVQKESMIFSCSIDLNALIHYSKTFFDRMISITDDNLSEILIQLQFLQTTMHDKQFDSIKLYSEAPISFSRLRDSVANINEMLITLSSESHFNSIKKEIANLHHVVTFLENIYNSLAENGFRSINEGNFTRSYNQHINYITPSQQNGYPLLYGVEKLETLIAIKSYTERLLSITYVGGGKPIVYIPVLRTSRTLGTSGDIFRTAIINQHFNGPPENLELHSGLELYDKISLARNGTRQQGRDFQEFEHFIGQIFFQSNDMHIVAHHTEKGDVKNIKVSLPGELEDISIHDLGDGVQAVINLLFPVFTATKGSWIFIDEPENHLHPGYQNIFMTAIMDSEHIKKKNLRFFINTHSNHILSGALMGSNQAEIFVFSRRDEQSSTINSFNGNEISTLEALGVLNTSVLISNCTVWIEGVTDRFYLQAFLSAYCKQKEIIFKPIEGLHYSFVEYGGKNLVHYDFDHSLEADEEVQKDKIEAYFINANVFLLADSDFNEKKHIKYENISRPNFVYCKTDLPEVENLLPDVLLKSFLSSLNYSTDIIEKIFPIKAQNIKLGKYFAQKLNPNLTERQFEGSGGTLSSYYKQLLANHVHAKIMDGSVTWDGLKISTPLKDIIERLYNFIKKKNSFIK